ncbi:MAG TPA: holo-ACP synthase [Mucilaginibacter sp.]|nr:holo-ACP synthase [Mucilaginibacter sp.]
MENETVKIPVELEPGKGFAAGNDLVFVPGFEASFTELFRNKVYTPGEIAYCERFAEPLLRYAATWAAKEAVYKALKQLDSSPAGWKKIEILREKIGGQPHVIIHKNITPLNISLSISHDGDYVWAIALIGRKA